MKKFILITLVASFLGAHSQNSMHSEFWKQDKRGHFTGTFLISSGTYVYLSTNKKYRHFSEFKKRLISFSTAMLIGCLKEVGDKFNSSRHSEWGDMEANLMGSLAFQITVSIPLSFRKSSKSLYTNMITGIDNNKFRN